MDKIILKEEKDTKKVPKNYTCPQTGAHFDPELLKVKLHALLRKNRWIPVG
jgi:hypothetical protein